MVIITYFWIEKKIQYVLKIVNTVYIKKKYGRKNIFIFTLKKSLTYTTCINYGKKYTIKLRDFQLGIWIKY